MAVGGTTGSGGKSGADFDAEVAAPVNVEALEAERDEEEQDRVLQLEGKVAELELQLAEARVSASKAEQRVEIERELTAAGSIDLEITVPLVEQVVAGMDEADVGKAVREVRSGKSFLFRTTGGGGVKSEAMAGEMSGAGVGLEDLASDARASGERGDLLRYLRARR